MIIEFFEKSTKFFRMINFDKGEVNKISYLENSSYVERDLKIACSSILKINYVELWEFIFIEFRDVNAWESRRGRR